MKTLFMEWNGEKEKKNTAILKNIFISTKRSWENKYFNQRIIP